jgi:hypothetical protein
MTTSGNKKFSKPVERERKENFVSRTKFEKPTSSIVGAANKNGNRFSKRVDYEK